MASYSPIFLFAFISTTILQTVHAESAPGSIVCRFEANSPSAVNYYTCTALANQFAITVDKFFELNPTVDKDCSTIKPNTKYCVAGYIQPIISTDGLCGPQHNNASCLGTDKQCCSAKIWKCGDQLQDCQAGTCYDGACLGFPSEYSMDGKCGFQNRNLLCGGKWGDCCSKEGKCGTGQDFCSDETCQSGNCTLTIPSEPTFPFPTITTTLATAPTSTTTPSGVSSDGTCGGANKYQCKGTTYGDCCSSSGYCGSTTAYCGVGCQANFGKCSAAKRFPPTLMEKYTSETSK
ncbi:carbohydrate-binding module family 18 protein [Lophiostoma macrostomum CBS 122681]|uniref:Carbohydrate-binding module family 18 protein n=1 Tax=Lophiostoma macrostomum CBS 122681 TaxID=1314788 RepID=A0A6A6TRK5_9PLEO|nr:carbohydrate-binding module family 18 protein [Lophiostoma macrostomum CBS 122681]